MRYYLKSDCLIVRGNFRAASNGVDGGLKDVRTLLNISVPTGFSDNASQYISRIANRYGFLQPDFGLLTAVPVNNMCICQYDEITAFVSAAVSDRNRTINIIVVSAKPFSDAALLGALMTITEAKMKVINERKLPSSALSTDAVIVAAEKNSGAPEEFAGPLTEIGVKITKAVSHALLEALVRFDNYLLVNWGVTRGWSKGSASMKRKRPSFFIYSRYGGDHWNEWLPEGCSYHPCHNFDNQCCDFCYCPMYPCKDTEFSEEIDTPRGKIWSCMDCRFIHEPAVVRHLKANPEASMAELKAARKR
ncbi:MAG TPA: adenosylcobinamide amidohydrolase [Methanocorpusculum sp.]|nr:adenosylcobinamide amidohydrolase [Methanocorpusculum sp.]HJJ40389.1 adenosylcobinamide amidohydrolase [Methanocorpusculum sp.]HJJ49684.1 adenosylcobinamide amidohydrolase [Methanocorpusculum sp.]HJJ57622.1 adenosylcobinamide amidohydrolase [Methanocorpusculum sp.]HJJ94959.1 adenosylcobinamide amidohydrolase [Methanocorpusculum sp.]